MSTPLQTMPFILRRGELHFAILGTLWLFGSASFSVAAERLAPDEAVAPRTATAPEIDGDLSDPVWQTAPRVEHFIDPQSGGAPFRTTRMQALQPQLRLGACRPLRQPADCHQ